MPSMKDYTKISISKDLHELVKQICDEKGLKMYYFEDEAIRQYIKNNHPEYIEEQQQLKSTP